MGELISILKEISVSLKAIRPVRENMNYEEAADYLGISLAYLGGLRGLYRIPFSKLGGRIIFRKKDLDECLDKNTVRNSADERRMVDGRMVHMRALKS